jgi:hypothetical protein
MGLLLSLMPYGQLVTLLLGKAQVSQAEQSQRKIYYRNEKKLAQIQAGVFEDQYDVGLPRLLPFGNVFIRILRSIWLESSNCGRSRAAIARRASRSIGQTI